MKSRARQRRGRGPAPTQLPPWWTPSAGRARPRVPSRPEPSAPPEPPGHRPEPDAGYRDEPPPGPSEPDAAYPDRYPDEYPGEYGVRDELLTHQTADAEPAVAPGPTPAVEDEPPADLCPPEPTPASQQTRQPLPGGRWTDGTDSATDVWIPAGHSAPPTDRSAYGAELEASRPADRESRRVRTSVDRPVSSLRPVSIDEARQLAECFALDYMSCDEDDPQLRQLALAPYLSRRSDALLGWPTERAGVGRQRAITARAGECLAQGRWVTVDVSVLVEIYQRDGSGPTEPRDPATERPELPPDARWSAVPPAHAPGWVCSMTVWQRLGIPIRRHDSGGLVVELFTVSEPES